MTADLHVHSFFCDGKSSPEELVKSAIQKGLNSVGIVTHSYVPFDDCCIQLEKVDEFKREIRRLKEKYSSEINVLCGLETDLYSPQEADGFNYTIGSVHYLKVGGKFFSVDESPEKLSCLIKDGFAGDFYACAEAYFAAIQELCAKKPSIVGHFDLIKKFQRSIPFDAKNQRYISAWQKAADSLLRLDIPFEINTGGISRGYIDEPYPSPEIAEYIKSKGGKLLLSSDAHRPEDIAFQFERWRYLI